MKITRWFICFMAIAVSVMLPSCGTTPVDFYSIPKIDAHSHIYTKSPLVMDLAQNAQFKWFSITTESRSQVYIDEQLEFAIYQKDKFPNTLDFSTAFTMENFGNPQWAKTTIERLQQDFSRGAIAVKVWKDIGMVFRDAAGKFIMIDDPKFDPVLEFIASQGKTLVAHIGEPKNCWLPVDSMTVNNDKKYFKRHPEYHMYLHPEYPSHQEIIHHRDNMLKKHPNLRVIGCHLGSLEWDVNEIGKRLDNYSNFAVDMAARICHFQVQDREKVRNFLIKYQDRIIYGTDNELSEKDDIIKMTEIFHQIWLNHWDYFATDKMMKSTIVDNQFQGLALPEEVLRKIYYENARKWYPGI